MQKIYFVVVGKIKESFYREAVAEYVKRLSRFAKVEIREIAEGTCPEAEAEGILNACRGYTIALAVEGERVSSEGLAALLKRLCDEGKEITFVIGSSCGLAERVKRAAREKTVLFGYDVSAPTHAGDSGGTGIPRFYDQRRRDVS